MKNGNGLMHFKIQKDALPDPRFCGPRKYDWPFASMKVGECFYFPLKQDDGVKQIYMARARIGKAAREYRATGMRFTTRHLDDKKSIGVWRVK